MCILSHESSLHLQSVVGLAQMYSLHLVLWNIYNFWYPSSDLQFEEMVELVAILFHFSLWNLCRVLIFCFLLFHILKLPVHQIKHMIRLKLFFQLQLRYVAFNLLFVSFSILVGPFTIIFVNNRSIRASFGLTESTSYLSLANTVLFLNFD